MRIKLDRITSNRTWGLGLGIAIHDQRELAWEAGDPSWTIEVGFSFWFVTWRIRLQWGLI